MGRHPRSGSHTSSSSNPLALRIMTIRRQRMILDADLARLYGVPTHRFNQAFKRNRRRFPTDFAFQLTTEEFTHLISQIAISSVHPIDQQSDRSNSSQIVMSSSQPNAMKVDTLNWSQFATTFLCSAKMNARVFTLLVVARHR